MKNAQEINNEQALEMVLASKDAKAKRIMDAAELIKENIQHEKQYHKKELGELLQMDVGSIGFQLAMSEVNQVLECDGYHLTTAGSNGMIWKVVALKDSVRVVRSMNAKGLALLKRSALFAQSTLREHGDKMTESDRRRLDKQSQIQAMRYVLAARLK